MSEQTPETTQPRDDSGSTSFADLGLNERIIKGLNQLEYQAPTPVQVQSIPQVLKQHDLLVNAETGSGKTAAFVLPAVQRFMENPSPKTGTRCLVLAPTRELAKQIYQHCHQLAAFTYIKAGVLTGGENFKKQITTIRKNPEFIIATPGRLLEHLEANNIDFRDLEMLVLDEADRMLDMGFAEEVLEIAEQCRKDRQTLLFSATLDKRGLKEVADKVLNNPQTLTINRARESNQSIEQGIIYADHFGHKDKLTAALLKQEGFDKALVFTNTKDRADKLRGFLQYNKIRVASLHGDMDQKHRNRVMEQLSKGSIDVVVATDVASRGLDIPGIDLVINYDMARNSDDYIHRIGRTGRAGKTGQAISLIAHFEWDQISNVQRYQKIRIPVLKIDGLEGSYSGPKKLKSNGKAAGPKKKKLSKGKQTTKKGAARKSSKPKNAKSNTESKPSSQKASSGLRRVPAKTSSRDGNSPLKRK